MKYTLEIATFNFHSAMLAMKAGADRIELCDNIHEGGTTPSYGTVKMVKETVTIPVFPMIRPRGGDFLYSPEELLVMKKDIQLFKQLGCEGVVLGFLNSDGTVHSQNTRFLVDLAYPIEVTFHRAFDSTIYPMEALEDVIVCGCQRILSSGQKANAIHGIDLIKQLIEQADDRIIIVPGGGIRSSNIQSIARETGAIELHSSAKRMLLTSMQYQNETTHEYLTSASVDVDEIIAMKQLLVKMVDD